MHIGVLGGSGRTGKKVIQEALDRGYEVTTLVRNAKKVDHALHDQIHIVEGDATSCEDIEGILDMGVTALIHTVSVPFFHKQPTTLYSRVSGGVIKAWGSTSHVCEHYIVMSSFGTHHGRKLSFPFSIGYEYFLGDVADDKEKEELLLEESTLPRTVVKAVLLDKRNVSTYVTTPFDSFMPSITKRVSRKAVANALLDVVGDDTYMRSKIVVS